MHDKSPMRHSSSSRRRAVVAVQVGVLTIVLLAFAALTVDLGAMYNARGDLQRSADAAAMAGALGLIVDETASEVSTAETQAMSFTASNAVWGETVALDGDADIQYGLATYNEGANNYDFAPTLVSPNAVWVTVRKTSDSPNGAMPLLFARVIGFESTNLSANAMAFFNEGFSGFNVKEDGGDLWPFSMHIDQFQDEVVNGNDNYSYADGNVQSSGDGIPEVNLYPDNNAPGNFGLLNIGSPNQGVPALEDQVYNGVAPGDMEAEIGDSRVEFYDDGGNAVTHSMTGNPGMKSSLKSALETRVGDVVGFFLHDGVSAGGANSVYNIVGIRFGRVMDVKMTGNPNKRGLWLQPVTYLGDDVSVRPDVPGSDGFMGRLMLGQ